MQSAELGNGERERGVRNAECGMGSGGVRNAELQWMVWEGHGFALSSSGDMMKNQAVR